MVPSPSSCEPLMVRDDKIQNGGGENRGGPHVLPLFRPIILRNHPCDHPPNLPLMLEVMAVVSSGDSPNDFYVVRKEDVIKRVHLNVKLSRDASFGLSRYQHGRHDSTVVVIYHNEYRWVRANVLNIVSTDYCSVRLIDYGDEVSVTENELKVPPTYAMELQPFAHRCAMNLNPTLLTLDPENLDGNAWDPKVMGKLKSIGESSVENSVAGIHGLTFKCTEIYQNTCVVDVQIIGRKTTWNQELVNRGLASFRNV